MPLLTVNDLVDVIDFSRLMGICPRDADGVIDERVYKTINRASYRMLSRGDWIGSFHHHPLGIPLLAVWTAWLAAEAVKAVRSGASARSVL